MYRFVTSCHKDGYELYGRDFLKGWIKHFPNDCELYVYYEGWKPDLHDKRITYVDLDGDADMRAFEQRHKDDPMKNGIVDGKYEYRYAAVRFSKKIFALTDPNLPTNGWRIWLDMDMQFIKDITIDDLDKQIANYKPEKDFVAHYIGRKDWDHSECGAVAYNLTVKVALRFLDDFRELYTEDTVFQLEQWHDSYLFDFLRQDYEKAGDKFRNICPNAEGRDVWDQTWLAEYMTHLKGPAAKGLPTKKGFEHRYDQIPHVIDRAQPTKIIELGVGDGELALEIAKKAIKHNQTVYYWGFDDCDLGPAQEKLDSWSKEHPGYQFIHYQGNIIKALEQEAETEVEGLNKELLRAKDADVVIVKGLTAVEDIQKVYEIFKDAPIVLFDYYLKPDENGTFFDIDRCGCNNVIKDLKFKELPHQDRGPDGGVIQMVGVGDAIKEKLSGNVPIQLQTRNCVPNETIQKNVAYSFGMSEHGIEKRLEQLKEKSTKLKEEYKQLAKDKKEALAQIKKLEEMRDNPVKWIKQCAWHDKTAVIVSGGPTVTDPNHPLQKNIIEEIKELAKKEDHYILCVKHSHDYLIDEVGLVPWGCLLLDPRDHVRDFIENPHPDVNYFVASMCAPTTWDRLLEKNAKVIGYNASVNAGESNIIKGLLHKDDTVDMLGGGSSSASRGVSVLSKLGFRNFIGYGYDSCYWQKPEDPDEKREDGSNRYIDVKVAGRSFWTDGELIAQSQDIEECIKKLPFCSFDFRGDGMIPHVASIIQPVRLDFESFID